MNEMPRVNSTRTRMVGLLVFAGLGLGSGAVMAVNDRVGGAGTVSNVVIDEDPVWDTLISEDFTLNATSDCMAVASSDLDNPVGDPTDQYEVVLSLDEDEPPINGAGDSNDVSQRRIELHDASGTDDPSFAAIGSTRFWSNVAAGDHTVYWVGSKFTPDATTADLTVEDSTLTLVCTDGTEL